ncbi:hypothetical protein [Helicobacter sp.]
MALDSRRELGFVVMIVRKYRIKRKIIKPALESRRPFDLST